MEEIPTACFCDTETAGRHELADCVSVACCAPCVYGGAVARARSGAKEPVDLCACTPAQLLATAMTLVVGDAALLCAGVYLRRTAAKNGDTLGRACLAECCPLCSFAPCQINDYRLAKTRPARAEIRVQLT